MRFLWGNFPIYVCFLILFLLERSFLFVGGGGKESVKADMEQFETSKAARNVLVKINLALKSDRLPVTIISATKTYRMSLIDNFSNLIIDARIFGIAKPFLAWKSEETPPIFR